MEKNIYLGYWPLKSVLEVELFYGEENDRGNLDFLSMWGGFCWVFLSLFI